jgi:hypothetical protein
VLQEIRLRTYPAQISLFPNGQLRYAPVVPGTRINALLVHSNAGGSTPYNYDVSFFENGQVQFMGLEEGTTIGGMTIKPNGGIGYYSNGQLNWLSPLASHTYVQGIPASEESSVAFDEKGTVKYASRIFEDVTVSGVLFKAGGEFRRPH